MPDPQNQADQSAQKSAFDFSLIPGWARITPESSQPKPPAAAPRPDALPGPYTTALEPNEEKQFQGWVKQNSIPWRDDPKSDYDMRGFWKAQQQGDPDAKRAANLHFPDTYKTPYHKSFSNESKYATFAAPHWEGNKLIDTKGALVFDENAKPATPAKKQALDFNSIPGHTEISSDLQARTQAQAKADLPRPTLAPPWEDEPRLPDTSPLGQAYDHAKGFLSKWEGKLSERVLAPFRSGLDSMARGLQQAGESGHTASGGQLSGPTRALVSGVGELLKQVPVGKDVKETALMALTPPEFPEVKGISRELRVGEKSAAKLDFSHIPGHTEVSPAAKELPAQPRLPDTGTHAALKTDDGSIYFDDAPEKQRTHIMLAQDLGIPPERIVSGGWLKDGEYEGSARSDAGKWGEQARAQAAVSEKRAARSSESERTPKVLYHGTHSGVANSVKEQGLNAGMLTDSPDLASEEAERATNRHNIQTGAKEKPVVFQVSAKPEEISDRGEITSATTGKSKGRYYDRTAVISAERVKDYQPTKLSSQSEQGPQPIAEKLGAKLVGSASKSGTTPKDWDFRVEGEYKPDETAAKLKQEGFEPRGSSLVSPKEAKDSGKDYGAPGWKRAEHFENSAGQKLDVWHDEAAQPWEKAGKDFESVYHGGKTKVGEVDPSKLQQRDAGFFGKGFYVTSNENFAGTYGSRVSKKTFTPDARILDVGTIHPQYEQKVNPELQKEIEATQRSYYRGLPKAQNDPGLVDRYMEMVDPKNKAFDLGTWVESVNRYAEKNGFDAIRFSDGEIVVKNPKALAEAAPKQSLADRLFSEALAKPQGGHAGGGVASVEELSRPGRFVKISKSGMPTDQGKVPDFNLKVGEAGYQVKADGSWELKAGQETSGTKLGVQNYAREVFGKRTPKKTP
jgi:hypothetical protein